MNAKKRLQDNITFHIFVYFGCLIPGSNLYCPDEFLQRQIFYF